MRAPVLLAALLLAAPFVAASRTADVRDVTANLVTDTRCPGQQIPGTLACFDVTGATWASIVARPFAGDAQPRMLVQIQNATVQWSLHWLCEDRVIGWGAENVTQIVVTLHADRDGCMDERTPVIARGTLTAQYG